MTGYMRGKLIKTHFAGVPVCPMAGKRAPELAAGCVSAVFDAIARQSLIEVLTDAAFPLSPALQAEVISDFQAARDHMRVVLLSKLDHWQRLHWVLCGLAHADEATARRIAQDIMRIMEDRPQEILHHRLTGKFLSNPLHEELCRFADGERFENLSEAFQLAVSPLHFIPVVETIIESKHASCFNMQLAT